MWRSLLFIFSSKHGECRPFLRTFWVCDLIPEACYVTCGECCPFSQQFWGCNVTFIIIHFFFAPRRVKRCPPLRNWGVQFDFWNLLWKTGEMLPILLKNVWGCNATFMFTHCFVFQTGGNAAPFQNIGVCNLIFEVCDVPSIQKNIARAKKSLRNYFPRDCAKLS